MYSGLFSVNTSPNPGLFFSCYNGYMNDTVNYFSNAAPLDVSKIVAGKQIYGAINSILDINTGTNSCISVFTNFSVQWLGYFKPHVTSSTWKFRITSDDCSYLWIGENAITGFTIANSNINNGGIHGNITVNSTNITLSQNIYYPLRIQFGQGVGGYGMKLEFSIDNINWYSNGTNFFFH